MAEKRWAFEDFQEGQVFQLPRRHVPADEIIEFASEFDAQPMHMDEEAGRASLLGGLAASGWHTCAVFMRMMFDGFLRDSTSQGSPGLNELRWRRPVLAGDTLSGHSTVLSKRRLKSKPDVGLVTFRHVVANDRGETVLDAENPIFFRLREPEGSQ
ncbi:MaoC family dehydratase [Chelativorans sp.]|uniref:MaoC family dehydratase n=1 Tax=Chelativorans sp. TaxID=2203393 RepID=UPI0028125DF5|nr:MaoC family dehydratase [Chelativorans sp.]